MWPRRQNNKDVMFFNATKKISDKDRNKLEPKQSLFIYLLYFF